MATYQGQSLMNYPDSHGQYFASTPSILPMKQAVGWEEVYSSTTKGPKKVPPPPENYYNYHNSLYETSTELLKHDDAQTDFDEYYYDDQKYYDSTVGPKPNNVGGQHSSFDPQKFFDENSQYQDYGDENNKVSSSSRPPTSNLPPSRVPPPRAKPTRETPPKGTPLRNPTSRLASPSSAPRRDVTKSYHHKMGPYQDDELFDYREDEEDEVGNDLDQRIRNIEHNDAIFRQDGADLTTLANYAASAIKILSLLFTVITGSDGGSSSLDRIDTGALAGAAAPASEVDLALGTLMAFGGKYLRSIAVYAWEHATQTPGEPLGVPLSPPASSSANNVVAQEATPEAAPVAAPEAVVVQTPDVPKQPYLSTISAQELENLGLKAVAAGAEPTKLQQAFAAAQLNGDWTKLEQEMALVLGPDAVGLGATQNVAATNESPQVVQTTGTGTTSTSSSSVSTVPSGLGYYVAQASNVANRITKVINGPDPSTPSYNLSEEEQLAQQSLVTRFIKEFHLEQEALALQYQANKIIRQVNNLIEGDPSTKIDKLGDGDLGDSDNIITTGEGGGGGGGGLTEMISAIPNMVGQTAVSIIKFITPAAPQQLEEKIDEPSAPGPQSGVSFSEIKPTVDMDTVTYAALGMGAVGTVLYGLLAAGGRSNEEPVRRSSTSKYKRSASPETYKQKRPETAKKENPNSKLDAVINTVLTAGVAGTIFYGVFLASPLGRRKRSTEGAINRAAEILWASIEKYTDQGKMR